MLGYVVEETRNYFLSEVDARLPKIDAIRLACPVHVQSVPYEESYIHFYLRLRSIAPAFAEKKCPISDARRDPFLILSVCCDRLPYLVNFEQFQI